MSVHSLTLAATSEMKKAEGIWHRSGLIKCPGACSGDVYSESLADVLLRRVARPVDPGVDPANVTAWNRAQMIAAAKEDIVVFATRPRFACLAPEHRAEAPPCVDCEPAWGFNALNP